MNSEASWSRWEDVRSSFAFTPEEEAEIEREKAAMSAACALNIVGRVNIKLNTSAAGELAKLQQRTGMSKTQVVNHALMVYGFVQGATAEGGQLFTARRGEERLTSIKIF